MVWLAVAVALILVAVFVLRKLRGATVYLSHSHGYTAFRLVGEEGLGDSRLRPVPRDRYERILARFLRRDLFECLWVSRLDDQYGGVTLAHEDGEVEMDASFRSLREPERVAAFRERMASWGQLPSDEHEWNVGLGVDSQSVTVSYRFGADLETLRPAVDRALEALQGEAGEVLYVKGWRSQDGPRGAGVTIRRPRDVLDEVP